MRLHHSFTGLFPFRLHFLTRKQLLRQGCLPLPWLESWSIQVSSSSAVSPHAKWQQQPCHQWCANHLHNRIDGQDDLKGCLQMSFLTSFMGFKTKVPSLRTIGAHEVLGKGGIHMTESHSNTCRVMWSHSNIPSFEPRCHRIPKLAAYEDASNGR